MKDRGVLALFIVVLVTLQHVSPVSARDLVDLLPGLYGGDGIQLAPVSAAGIPDHGPDFGESTGFEVNRLNDQIASEIRPLPVTPSAGGVTFKFDRVKATYTPTSETLGPVAAERPQTLGRGKFSTAFSFSYFSYDEFEGRSLDNLTQIGLHELEGVGDPNVRDSFELDTVNITIDTDIDVAAWVFSGTYGVTDRLDLGLAVPILHVNMDVDASAKIISSPQNPFSEIDPATGERFTPFHRFDDRPGTDQPNDSASDSATGVGDVLLSAKYYALSKQRYDLSGALQVKLETGDEDNFLGTGSTTIRPFVIASGDVTGAIRAHINLGYEFDLGDSDRDVLNYAVGVDAGNQTITGAFDFLGRNELHGDGIGNDIYDMAFGLKWRVVEHLIISGNVLIPVNDQGLRADAIGLLGIELRN